MNRDLPNIVLINTDQQRADTIGALGQDHMETPNLDRLAEEGVAFTNNFTTAPSCVPARASLFSGFFPHNTNVLSNGDSWSPGWIDSLAETGYHCVNVGKMHTVPPDVKGGFHERYIVENKDRPRDPENPESYFHDEWDKYLAHRGVEKPSRKTYMSRPNYDEALGAFSWPLEDEDHSDFFVGNMARWWIEQYEGESPVFLEIGFPGPHPPYDPIERYVDLYREKDLPLPEVAPEEIEKQPPPQRAYRKEMINHNASVPPETGHDAVQWKRDPSGEQLHRLRAHYYANVTMIDEKIGEILDALEEKDALRDSVVIFTADHGDALGDHGHIQKWTMYDCSVNVPLLFWSPDRFSGGKVIDSLVQWMDIAPTVLELAGLEVPKRWDAKSLLPLLEGRKKKIRDYVFSEHGKDWAEGVWDATEFMTMIRSEKHKLVHYMGEEFGELYDLESDPEEKVNLWQNESFEGLKQDLLKELYEWRMKSEYRAKPTTLEE